MSRTIDLHQAVFWLSTLKSSKDQEGTMDRALIDKYSTAVPRYTSYPTAPQFSPKIDNSVYSQWLSTLGKGQTLSLYVHIPYCDRLCWFCACHTKHTLQYAPVKTYLEALHCEIEAVGRRVSPDAIVTSLHLGGGSPTMVKPEDMIALALLLKSNFTFSPDAEISVEMDPNDLDEARFDTLAAIDMTRASLGIQDFDPQVQNAINRIQTFEQTRHVVESVRKRGVRSVNCDVLYGLPFQTIESVKKTIDAVISLDPDRIALFGYAHVPWMKKHQVMIKDETLPDVYARFAQMQDAGARLLDSGYQAIGIDHFAKPGDGMAIAACKGTLKRNFQGYTNDQADALIGLGASAIGQLPQGHIQNSAATADYMRMAHATGLAAVRGVELSEEDRLRAWAIERLMCDFEFSFSGLRQHFGQRGLDLVQEARSRAILDVDGFVALEKDRFVIRERENHLPEPSLPGSMPILAMVWGAIQLRFKANIPSIRCIGHRKALAFGRSFSIGSRNRTFTRGKKRDSYI